MSETEIKPVDSPSTAADVVEETKGAVTQGSDTIESAPAVEVSIEKENEPEVVEIGTKRSIDETEDAVDSAKDDDDAAADASKATEQPEDKKAKIASAEDENAEEEEEEEDDEEFNADDAEEEEDDDEEVEGEDDDEELPEDDDEPEIVEGEDDINLVSTIEQAESELEVGATPTAAEA
ncbi:hypothetical protein D0Z00_004350 [Geotrichum galactomycetum]|uniref:Uncharacterized protein n=1 Tax=Geotrichum galactomycetum TaxID=27317 RepID=A0ACB6UYN5_9ASCO|nr:hypothetical protein D0Z00_004350 [Geotrichum candidum]